VTIRENHPGLNHEIGVVVAAVREIMPLGDRIIAIPCDIA